MASLTRRLLALLLHVDLAMGIPSGRLDRSDLDIDQLFASEPGASGSTAA